MKNKMFKNEWNSPSNDCNCEKGNSAMVFIQPQKLMEIYAFSDAFKCGTLFPELNKPFLGGGCHYGR